MPSIRVPAWHAALPADAHRVIEAFSELLAVSRLTQRDLAARLNASPKTVNHWATGRTTPSLETMTEATDALEALLRERLARAKAMQTILRDVRDLAAPKAPRSRTRRQRLQRALAAFRREDEA